MIHAQATADPGGDRERLIVVLGMHRSGTSAITRGLKALGVELGDNLYAPDPEINAKGYWEDADLAGLNIRLLQALDSEWHDTRPLPCDFVDRLTSGGFLLQAVDLLRAKLQSHRVFGFKDPRNSLLLPFWKRAFAELDSRVVYVLAVRNPLSVIESLARRDQFDFKKSAQLWLLHSVHMLENTSFEKERVVVDYDILMESPGDALRRIGRALALDVIPGELDAYEREFLDRTLRHSEHDPDHPALTGFMGTMLPDLYAALRQTACGTIAIDSEAVLRQLSRARRELDSADAALALAG
ncbi:MAG TPA: sulfotransferase [Steroidobacteraceae bacterium]